jgi:transcriptional regulator with XRE-family HTH domain
MNQSPIQQFSAHLRRLRQKRKLSQEKLSELAGVDYKHIQRLESKNPCDVKLSTLYKLAKAFNMSPSKLLNSK